MPRPVTPLLALALLSTACFADHPPELGTTGTTGEAGTATSSTSGTTGDPTTEDTGPLPGCPSTMPPGTWYIDQDRDSWGGATEVIACDQPPGAAPEQGDCDDDDPEANPGAIELCDGGDDDCDGLVDEYSPMNEACDGCSLAGRGGSLYWFCVADAIAWTEAYAACTGRGASVDLASIHSAEEDAFVVERATALVGAEPTGPFWIGLRRPDPDWKVCGPDGPWVWTDGTGVDYLAWSPGQPDGGACDPECEPTDLLDPACPRENCGELLFMGGWNDGACGGAGVGYVCRAPAPP